jgi:hypothetical protein
MMDGRMDRVDEPERTDASDDLPDDGRAGRLTISPRLSYLLIGGAALGLIVLMCLVVALLAALQSA